MFFLVRTGVGITARLRHLPSFSVEVFFKEKRMEVVRLVSLDDTSKLEDHLHQITRAGVHALPRV